LAGSRVVRTGIDLGTGSVKLARGEGRPWLDRITHLGVESWEPTGDDIARASSALRRLMKRLNLSRRRMGHIAVAVGGEQSSIREVFLPSLSEDEFRQALPYEAKRHLPLEGVPAPVLDFQILGTAPSPDEGGPGQVRVLLAAIPGTQRSFVLQVLQRAGLEPAVIDLEPLSQLNAMLAVIPEDGDHAFGLLDLGARQASLHITQRSGRLLTRVLGPSPTNGSDPGEQAYAKLAVRIRETLTFYRGRYRQDVFGLYAGGGGALVPEALDRLGKALGSEISVLDPIGDLAQNAEKPEDLPAAAPRFVTACGLCRWWDHV
jgi:Tfp pilus assembly PilM family ATPase